MSVITEAHPAPPGRGWRLAAVLVMVVVAGGDWGFSQLLDARHAFALYNTLFDADPNVRVMYFSSGWGDFSLVHPWSWLISLPIRLYGAAVTALLPSLGAVGVRREAALVLMPASAALASGVVLAIAWRAGLGAGRAILVQLLFAAFFAQALFGAVPDYPVLSGLTVAAALGLLTWEAAGRRLAPTWIWLGAMLVCAGVTSTNAVPVVAAFAASRLVGGWTPKRVAGVTAALAAVVGVSSVAGWALGQAVYRPYPIDVAHVVARYSHVPGAFDLLARFPVALGASVVPPEIGVLAVPPDGVRAPSIAFSLEPHGWHGLLAPTIWVVLALVAVGAAGLRRREAWGTMRLAALIVVAHNWALHSWYGTQTVLFGANWTPALAVLVISALRSVPRAWDRATGAVLVAAVGTTLVIDWQRARFVLHALDAALRR